MKGFFRFLLTLSVLILISSGILYHFRDLPNLKIYSVNLFGNGYDHKEEVFFNDSIHYRQLDDKQKYIYAYFYHNATNDIYDYELGSDYTLDDIAIASKAFENDYPQYYYLSIADWKQYTSAAMPLSYAICSYKDQQYQIKAFMSQMEERAREILKETEDDDEYERIRKIYDYVLKHVEYVKDSEYNQDLRSSILLNQSVCSGYAKMFQYLLQQAGYECYFVSGAVSGQDELHAWDILKYHDHYYWFDPTFDDSEYRGDDYFFSFDEIFLKEHFPADFEYPECNDDSLYMYHNNTLFFRDYDPDALYTKTIAKIDEGYTQIRWLFMEHDDYVKAYEHLLDDELVYDIWNHFNEKYGYHSCRYNYSDDGNYLVIIFE